MLLSSTQDTQCPHIHNSRERSTTEWQKQLKCAKSIFKNIKYRNKKEMERRKLQKRIILSETENKIRDTKTFYTHKHVYRWTNTNEVKKKKNSNQASYTNQQHITFVFVCLFCCCCNYLRGFFLFCYFHQTCVARYTRWTLINADVDSQQSTK